MNEDDGYDRMEAEEAMLGCIDELKQENNRLRDQLNWIRGVEGRQGSPQGTRIDGRMSTKHKPETPLPWVVGKYPHGTKYLANTLRSDNLECAKEEEKILSGSMEYIVHACNAYPRLVDCLSEIVLLKQMGEDTGLREAAMDAEGLLKELGEIDG